MLKLSLIAGIFAIASLISTNCYSQIVFEEDYSSDSVLYKQTLSGGVIFHNRGYGAGLRRGKNQSVFRNVFYEINLINTKSPKQIRSINPYFPNSKSFVYGKLNELFVLRGGVGTTKQINRKPYWGGVELRYIYAGGVSLGIAKPVYFYTSKFGTTPEIYETEKFDPDLSIFEIVGRAPFTMGMNEIKLHPGIYAKAGLDFEFGSYKSKINSLELGTVLELFFTNIQLMADKNPQRFFFTFYISYSFGKRYNVY